MKRRSFLGLLVGAVAAPKVGAAEVHETGVFNRIGPLLDDVMATAEPAYDSFVSDFGAVRFVRFAANEQFPSGRLIGFSTKT